MRVTSAAQRAATTETLFAQVCRATPQEARDLSMLLTLTERAELAVFCYARTHSREQGKAIASACTRESLARAGGHAGFALFDQAQGGADNWGATAVVAKRSISLAR